MDEIVIIGAGGIGCAVGYALQSVGVSVLWIETNPTKIAFAKRHGVAMDSYPALPTRIGSFADWTPHPTQTVLLCTKCYDNATLLQKLPVSVDLIPIQNGFDAELRARNHTWEGIASFVSECPSDSTHTRMTRAGDLHFGPRVRPESPLVDHPLAKCLQQSRFFRTRLVSAIEPYKYTKLMYNAAISPIAAAAGLHNGELLSVPEARRLFFALLLENYQILKQARIELGKIGPFHPDTVAKILKQKWVSRLLAKAFEPSLRGTYCSMAPDLPKGRTEIGHYNQWLVDLAGEAPCPLNRRIVQTIRHMEQERIAPNRAILQTWLQELEASQERIVATN